MEMCKKMAEDFVKSAGETKTPRIMALVPFIPLVIGGILLVLGIVLNAAAVRVLWLIAAGVLTAIGLAMPIMINRMFKEMGKTFTSDNGETAVLDATA